MNVCSAVGETDHTLGDVTAAEQWCSFLQLAVQSTTFRKLPYNVTLFRLQLSHMVRSWKFYFPFYVSQKCFEMNSKYCRRGKKHIDLADKTWSWKTSVKIGSAPLQLWMFPAAGNVLIYWTFSPAVVFLSLSRFNSDVFCVTISFSLHVFYFK